MRVLYIDIDSLRPDHLGCYGYDRDTSPTIDLLAEEGRRFTNYYTSDAPCLPSRTGLFSSRFGIHTGVVNHGGLAAEPRRQGYRREFTTQGEYRTWPATMRDAGYHTAIVSPFPTRHGAWHVLDGFDEWIDTGGLGHDLADAVYDRADDWLDTHATEDDWHLHVNFWDPHTPYETPLKYGHPFEDAPAPEWLTDERIAAQRESSGPFCARDLFFYDDKSNDTTVLHGDESDGVSAVADERMPDEIDGREAFKQWIDGYDTGVRYADDHIGKLLDRLRDAGVYEDTLVIVSADHGESLGEYNVYGDHTTADDTTCRVPLVVHGPDVEPGIDDGFHYHVDLAPTVTELVGGEPAPRWDGQSFVGSLVGTDDRDDTDREYLVLGHAAWTCQRSVRFDEYLLVRTFHDAYMDLDPLALFDLDADPHETENLAEERPGVVARGLALLDEWTDRRLMEVVADEAGGNPDASNAETDPLWEVLNGGGPYHPRTQLERYLERLRATDREAAATRLERTRGYVPQHLEMYRES